MRKEVLTWLGREFLFLSAEAKLQANATEETREIFQRFQNELQQTGLSLDNTVRTRLWGKDRESRDQANEERFRTLTGKARSVSSSYYSPSHFASDACVALDLLALRPSRAGMEKFLKEYDPPLVPLRYLIYDKVVFLSGVTAILPTIEDQLANILPRISGSLSDAGSSWERVAKVSFYLHRNESLDRLRAIFQETVKADIPQTECAFVDGYSNPGKLIEIEVTATVE
jgi:enamine deaminase RidA (YjgF/YER057c/UK114 family)